MVHESQVLDAPDWLPPAGREAWPQIAAAMHERNEGNELFTIAMAIAATAIGHWHALEAALEAKGRTTNSGELRPLHWAAAKARSEAMKALGELRITPSSVGVIAKRKPQTLASKYFPPLIDGPASLPLK